MDVFVCFFGRSELWACARGEEVVVLTSCTVNGMCTICGGVMVYLRDRERIEIEIGVRSRQ